MVLLEQNSQRSNPYQAIIPAIVFSNPLILSLKIQMQFTGNVYENFETHSLCFCHFE